MIDLPDQVCRTAANYATAIEAGQGGDMNKKSPVAKTGPMKCVPVKDRHPDLGFGRRA